MNAATDFRVGNWIYSAKNNRLVPARIDATQLHLIQDQEPTEKLPENFKAIPLTLQLLEKADFHFLRTPDGAMKHGSIDTLMIRHTITEEGDHFLLHDEQSGKHYHICFLHHLQNIFSDDFNCSLEVNF